ncbi:MAG: simple sugar transport system permease protein [Frankiales bacterium]|jgi:simple sugar transport system permease protein|nr:simple sugar transport system permease protein [Frankiales bacterium]
MTDSLSTSTTEPVSEPLVLDEPATRRRSLADNQPTTTWSRLKENLYYLRGRGALEITIVYAVIVLAFVVYSLSDRAAFPFLSSSNLAGVVTQSIPVLALLAIGAGILMISGEFDLSMGASIGFAGVVFIRVVNNHAWPIAFVLAVGSAMLIALINGYIVVLTRIPSFIATLGMSFFWTGASIYINGTTPAVINSPGEFMTNVFTGNFGFFRAQLLWMIGIGIIAWFFLHRHRRGNHIYAVGGNAAAARAVSIKPNSVRLMAFGIFGMMTGLAAVLTVVRTDGMQPGTTSDLTLYAIAAAVVGGCSLAGGRGTVVGMIIGAALIRTVENGLILAKAPGFYIQLFVGLTIVVAATINKLMEGRTS